MPASTTLVLRCVSAMLKFCWNVQQCMLKYLPSCAGVGPRHNLPAMLQPQLWVSSIVSCLAC